MITSASVVCIPFGGEYCGIIMPLPLGSRPLLRHFNVTTIRVIIGGKITPDTATKTNSIATSAAALSGSNTPLLNPITKLKFSYGFRFFASNTYTVFSYCTTSCLEIVQFLSLLPYIPVKHIGSLFILFKIDSGT